MNLPIVDIAGNLVFGADGSAWAIWRAQPIGSAIPGSGSPSTIISRISQAPRPIS